MNIDIIARGFIAAALWADCPEGTNPHETRKARSVAREFCTAFLNVYPAESAAVLLEYAQTAAGYDAHAQFGHDIYMTCAGHGVGFGDRGYGASDTLAELTRRQSRRWHIETEFYRGWMQLHAPNYTTEE